MKHISLLLMFFASASALIAYDCNYPDSGFTTLSLMSNPVCERKSFKLSSTQVTSQIVQYKNYDSVKYFQCLVIYDVLVTRCGSWFNDNLAVTSYSHVLQISNQQCSDLHNFRNYNDPQFPHIHIKLNNDKGEFLGSVVGSNDNGDCVGSTFYSHKPSVGKIDNVHVHIQMKIKINRAIGNLNLNSNILTLKSGYQEDFNKLQMFDPINGNTFWTTSIDDKLCSQKKLFVVFEGLLTKSVETSGKTNKTLFLPSKFK